nr:unnamed protein product [Naegleria fowleri]
MHDREEESFHLSSSSDIRDGMQHIADHVENIFQQLPYELIEVIVGYLNSVELILSVAKVCKHWRDEVVFPIVKEQYKTLISEIYPHHQENDDQFEISSMMDFYTKIQGQRFVKQLLRKCVFELAIQIQKHAFPHTDDVRTIECNLPWLESELSILKGYFANFICMKETNQNRTTTTNNSNTTNNGGGLFKGVLDYMASLFGKISSSNSTSSSTNKPSNQNEGIPKKELREYDFLIKALLDGVWGAGKTSFLRASIHDTPPDNHHHATIGVDFGLRTFVFGNEFKIRFQLWDQCGPERFRSITASYYRGASCIFLLIDLTDKNEWLKPKIQDILEQAKPGTEVIVIGTKTDLHEERKISRQDLEKMAFETFKGSLYVEITNTKIEEPKTVLWYSVLLRYLLSVNVTDV